MTGVQALDREESSSNHRWRRATAPPGGRERSREQSTMERSSPPEPARALSSKRVTAAADSPVAPDSSRLSRRRPGPAGIALSRVVRLAGSPSGPCQCLR